MRRLNYTEFVILPLILLIAACASLSPKTPREALAATEIGFTAVVEGLTGLRDAGVLGPETLVKVAVAIRTGDNLLNLAQTAMNANLEDQVESLLRQVETLVSELEQIYKDNK